MAHYDTAFFDYVNSGSVRSAERLLPTLYSDLAISSVLDIGCGQGAWLSVWNDIGIEDITGVDGDYVNRQHLLIANNHFQAADLSKPFNLERRFDLVQSLEVAEHLPPFSAEQFVDHLCLHGDLIFFSAAPPGQGGDHHVNERPYEYWRQIFKRHGYSVFDYIRPLAEDQLDIEPWYRYNTFLYVAENRIESLPEHIRATQVPSGTPLVDVSPISYRIRKSLIRLLPVRVMTLLAKLKERHVARLRKHAT